MSYLFEYISTSGSDNKSFKYKTKTVGQTSEIPPQPGNPEDEDQPVQLPVSRLTYNLVISRDFLIYL